MSAPTAAVQAKLEASRQELLDLGLRNPLLNYRPPRARGVVIVDELPAEVFRLLVTEAKSLSFLPAENVPAEGLLEQPPDPAEPPKRGKAPRHLDKRLQTGLGSAQLQATLLNTHHAARSFIEEQGANALFVALGMLEWFEPGNRSEARRAPLILVPVAIARASALARFQIRYTGEEIGENLSLAARLKGDANLSLPALPALEDLDFAAYFDAVEAEVAEHAGWRVDRDAVVLGFFAYGKFLMYRDLDPGVWPGEANPTAHPVLQALLLDGFKDPPAALGADDQLDATFKPGDPPAVVDADSSQTLAVAAARGGRNLVIQGPPGTGKSQTITNLVADALARGQTVLFVAEKLAALEVVKRRLDAVGLGDACLELHSHKASKKAVLAELQRTLGLGRPVAHPAHAEDLALYAELRENLNETCEAINTPVGASGVTPYQAMGLLARERFADLPPGPVLAIPGLEQWSSAEWKRRLALVEQIEAQLAASGPLARHPFKGAGLREWRPALAAALAEHLGRARGATRDLQAAIAPLAEAFNAALPPDIPAERVLDAPAAGRLVASLHRLAGPPNLAGVQFEALEWLTRHDDLRRLTAAGARLAALRRAIDAHVVPEAWEENLLETRLHLAAHGRKPWRFLIGDYRRASQQLEKLCRGQAPTDLEARLALIDALAEGARQRAAVRDLQGLGQQVFGLHWQGLDSDWDHLAAVSSWLHELNVDLGAGRLSPTLPTVLAAHPAGRLLPAGVAAAEAAVQEHDLAWQALAGLLAHAEDLAGLTFADQEALLQRWESEAERLPDLVSFNQLAARLVEEGLAPMVNLAQEPPPGGLSAALKHAWYVALLDRALAERKALATFSGAAQEIEVGRFRDLDVAIATYNRASLALQHWGNLPHPGAGGGQLAVLTREFEKKARHLPLRQLLARAGQAVQQVKPVFMMSPLSIATFLAPEGPRFDLVVFDEASQVKPVDAFGAILRGSQVVVVGDKRQMPPTSFFDAQVADLDDEDEDSARDFESILGLMEAQGAPQHMLRWHYRSRHESLIAVSNQAFYDGKLVVFPSPDAGRAEAGLRLHYLPDAVYERGSSRTNPVEARRVAEAVMAHARSHPGLSLGVAAFSMAQMQAIEQEVEKARRADPSCEPFFAAHPHEPFFVKNLETVQGDEREVMYISTGYGPDAEGKLALAFGPLNLEGGERRLNVLITRARLRCEVFTSLRSDRLPQNETTPRGVAALRGFLAYAESGALAARGGGEDGDGLVEAIANEIRALGFSADRHVGAANFFLDLAVRDPEQPGRYLLAVSCDGPVYAGARAARDRDRLRVQVLEGLGWRVHRIWSLDWHNRPGAERRRLQEALEAARAALPPQPVAAIPAEVPAVERLEAETPAPTSVQPYAFAELAITMSSGGLAALATNALAKLVADVVAVEGPVHVSEVTKRIAAAAGLKRPGAKVATALEAGVAHAAKTELVKQRGEFLWPVAMEVPAVRDRSAIPAAQRKLELIAPEERLRAVESAVADGHGQPVNEKGGTGPKAVAAVALAAAKLLGYTRPNDEVRAGLEATVAEAIAANRLVEQGDHLHLAD